jgi:glycosyltransferase involved in cell wall biosynthesis
LYHDGLIRARNYDNVLIPPMIPPRLSATVLTLNEERNIERCLASLSWADEIVVVDAGSQDRTLELARRYTDRIITHAWSGFLAQRSYAFEHCNGQWILFMDADEWVPAELAEEIRKTIAVEPVESAFWISRKNWFLDRWIHYSWSPDHVLRLFRRDAAELEGYEPHVHLKLKPGHTSGTLGHHFLHDAYQSVSDLLVKVNRYSTLFANSDATDPLYSPWKLFLSPVVSIFKTYVLKQGFRDGVHGLIIASASAHYHFLKYAKKWEKLRRRARKLAPQPVEGASEKELVLGRIPAAEIQAGDER